jgi:hypothetical protein
MSKFLNTRSAGGGRMARRPGALCLAAAGLMAGAALARADWSFTSAASVETRPGETLTIRTRSWVSGDKARMEFEASQNPAMPAGSYWITQDGGKTMTLVNPADQTYYTLDADGLRGVVGGAAKAMKSMMPTTHSDLKVDKLIDEDGGKIAGQATRHLKYRTSYSSDKKLFGMKSITTSTVREEEVWIARHLKFPELAARAQAGSTTGDEDLDKLIATRRPPEDGFVLKQVVVTTTTDSKGAAQTSRMTMEVSDLKQASAPAGAFEVPAGYALNPAFSGAADRNPPARPGEPRQPGKNIFRTRGAE